jgi:hypothetical protein
MAIKDMFVFLKRCMEPFMEKILKLLLKKASDTNIFIAEEAEKAIEAMCQNCQDTKVLSILLSHCGIKQVSMRYKVAKGLVVLTGSLGNNILHFKEADKVVSQLAVFLADAS